MTACPNSRVIKKLNPGDAGTLKLAERYGSDLVCVRYRETDDGAQRLTTIELVIDIRDKRDVRKTPRPRLRNDDLVRLALPAHATQIHQRLKAYGAKWDPDTQTWVTRWLIAKHLKLTHRQVR